MKSNDSVRLTLATIEAAIAKTKGTRPAVVHHPDDRPRLGSVLAWWEANGGRVIVSKYVQPGKVYVDEGSVSARFGVSGGLPEVTDEERARGEEIVTLRLKRADVERLNEVLVLLVLDHEPMKRLQAEVYPHRWVDPNGEDYET